MKISKLTNNIPLGLRIVITGVSYFAIDYFYDKTNRGMPDLSSLILIGVFSIIFTYGLVSIIRDWKKGGIRAIIKKLFGEHE